MKQEIVKENGKRYLKVKKGEYYDKKKSRKMKKHHPVRWILISAFCLLIVAPVGFIFGAFYDPSTKQVADTSEKFTENFTNKLSEGLTNIAKDNKLVIELDNDFLDSALVLAQDNITSDPTLSNFIKKIYCNIDGENYDFVVDAQLSFFKTRLHIKTVMSLNEETNTYIFKISDIVVGRLPLGNLAKSIIPNFLSEAQINQAIHAIPLNANFSLSNLEITYKRETLKSDIYNLLNKINLNIMNSPLSSVLLGIYSDLDSYATFKDKITMVMDFTNFKKPLLDIRNKINENFKVRETKYSQDVTKMLNDKIISTDESGKIFKFFLTGISDDAKKIFDAKPNAASACKTYIKDATGVEVSDLTTYTGDNLYVSSKIDKSKLAEEIEGLPKSTIDLAQLKNGITLKISENNLSKFLRSTPMMGFTFDMPLESNGVYTYNYVAFDDFSVNIETDVMNIFGCINLNGVQLPLTIESNVNKIEESKTERELNIVPSKIFISTIELKDDVKNNLLNYISSGLTSGDLFSFNKDSKSFVLNTSAIDISTGITTVDDAINGIFKCQTFTLGGKQITTENMKFSSAAKRVNDKSYLEFTIKVEGVS